MIDLHTHILPACDDGSPDLATSIAMARMAVADGIRVMACTPHIMPGLYHNDGEGISRRTDALQAALDEAGVDLRLVTGADIHIVPDLAQKLTTGFAPTLAGTRYFLLEPPHHVLPPRFAEFVQKLISAGYTPILTHPERLTWMQAHYGILERVNAMGALLQITAGSVTGNFGASAQKLAERMLGEGRVDLFASDAHNLKGRPPVLSRAFAAVEASLGLAEANRMFVETPGRILANERVEPVGQTQSGRGSMQKRPSGLRRLLGNSMRHFLGDRRHEG
ncbi:tyrosine-protein phosphatase [Kaistia terrae]|uniref:protein-tyrosine-phosphatase n=1 Tax=Kaistia terrae TaxID=537017 RepID=A0ABW0PWY3_9HYPH|nr:CpsB/CapC family capsule biosynthesis tyrosine phosphatase [Kaistia terrae]MCX5576729.1 capsular biosynthesis protein [Kaistia terrae]